MPSISFNITGSDGELSTNVSAGSQLTMSIQNPTDGSSYFTLETVPNSDGFYDSSSPKNMSGSFELKSGVIGLVRDDYKMGAVIEKGSSELVFTPAINVVGNTVKVRGISGISFGIDIDIDIDAQAFFDRVTTAGGSLSTTEQDAVNTLVVQMKADGIWTKMKAIYPMVGASAASCAQNLKSSSFTGAFSSGWDFASTGVTPTNAYMDTGLAPSGNLTNNNTHISYYSKTDFNATSGNNSDIGVSDLASASYLPIAFFRVRSNNSFQVGLYNYGGSTYLSSSNGSSLGFFVGNRTSNNLLNSWKNGTKQGTNTNLESLNITTVTNNFYLGALNLGGSAAQFSNRECAFASIGDGLTDTEASDFYTAVQAFQTTLSRNV
jgi:hypothetical protein